MNECELIAQNLVTTLGYTGGFAGLRREFS